MGTVRKSGVNCTVSVVPALVSSELTRGNLLWSSTNAGIYILELLINQ